MSLKYKKAILRKFPSGLFILTAKDGEEGTGAVISFATQISVKPPYIALAIRKGTNFYSIARNTEHIAVNIPSKNQQSLVASFFKIKKQTTNSINGFTFKWSELKTPILDDVQMAMEVKIIEIIDKGDHPLFICEVVNTILREDVDILTMSDTNWKYGG